MPTRPESRDRRTEAVLHFASDSGRGPLEKGPAASPSPDLLQEPKLSVRAIAPAVQ
jgi:hypothetical protein